MARPKKDTKARASKIVKIRVTPEEYTRLVSYCQASGYATLSRYLRNKGLLCRRELPSTHDQARLHSDLYTAQLLEEIDKKLDALLHVGNPETQRGFALAKLLAGLLRERIERQEDLS